MGPGVAPDPTLEIHFWLHEWGSGVGSGARSWFQECLQEWLQIPLLKATPGCRSGVQEWDVTAGVAPDPTPETHPRQEWVTGVGCREALIVDVIGSDQSKYVAPFF